MTQTAQIPNKPIDSALLAESKAAGVPYKAYVEMSPRERASARGRHTRSLNAEAKRRGIPPAEFAAMSEDERARAREQHPERTPLKPRTIETVIERHATPDEASSDDDPEEEASAANEDDDQDENDPEAEPEEELDVDDQEDAEMHGASPAVPPTETRPEHRKKLTMGEVTVSSEDPDLVGGKQKPRTLRDVYARWQIAPGAHLLRVERIEPKVWQTIHCAGYVGEIREPITEEDFHAHFGGRKYEVTVYGPDPKGRVDDNGEPIMKAKTEPFEIIVPALSPNFNALPLVKDNNPMNGTHTFAPPTTPADATIHKTQTDFLGRLIDKVSVPQAEPGAGTKVVEVLERANDKVLEAIQRETGEREKILSQRNRELTDELKATQKRLEAAEQRSRDQQLERRDTGVTEAVNAVKNAQEPMTRELSATREQHAADLQRLKDSHQEELRRLNDNYAQERARERDRHEDEMKRERLRVSDFEQQYRLRADDIDRAAKQREQDLREQIAAVRAEERAHAERRIADITDSHKKNLDFLKEQHERELRINESNTGARLDNSRTAVEAAAKAKETSYELQINSLKEKIATLKEKIEELEEAAKENGDPVAVLDKAREQAEALGYVKENENGPTTVWERVGTQLAESLGASLRTAPEWLPKAATAFRQVQPPPGASPGAPGPQRGMMPAGGPPGAPPPGIMAERPMNAPRRRTVSWGSQDEPPVAQQHQVIAGEPIPPQPHPAAPPPVPAAAAAPPPPAPAAPQALSPAAAPAPEPQPAPNLPLGLDPGVVMQFVRQVDAAISAGAPAEMFAEQFHAQFPSYAARVANESTAKQFLELVESMPGSEQSAILRRTGTQWVTKLWDDLKRRTSPS